MAATLLFTSTSALAVEPEAPVTTGASAVTSTTAKLNGVLNPNHEGEAGTYEFFYRKSATECQGESAVGGSVEAHGLSPEPVAPEEVTGLSPGTTYTACLVAINKTGETALGNSVSFTTLAVTPTVAEEFVDEVSSGSATLHGLVNPGGADTTYRFEYGPTASYGESLSGYAGTGLETVPVKANPQGLTPGVLYHYRLLAGNEIDKEVVGPDRTFTTQPVPTAFVLPDGRQWELVSPPDKNGAEVTNVDSYLGGDFQAAESGEAVTYITNAPVGSEQRSSPFEPQILSRRGPDGWSSQDISTPHERPSSEGYYEELPFGPPRIDELSEYLAFSPDLSLAYVEPEHTTPLAPPAPHPKLIEGTGEYNGGYVRDDETGVYDATALKAKQWYEEQLAASQPPPECDAATSPAGSVVGQNGVLAVSWNGCYVYFNAEAGSGPLDVAHYNGSKWTTTFISSLSGTGAPEWGGEGMELSPNGRYLAFMSNLGLTGYDNIDVNSPPGQPQADEEVYLYDAATNRLFCASCDPTGARPAGQLDAFLGETHLGGGVLQVDIRGVWAFEGYRTGHLLAGLLPPRQITNNTTRNAIVQPRYVTDGGELFFDSPLALVPQDVNGIEDVYEFKPPSAAGCEIPAGCAALISSGTSIGESVLVGASTNGSDVFFFTDSRLVPGDIDNVTDMYDAHVCSTSVPCIASPPVSLQPCETSDSCKAPPTPQPAVFGQPPSATFAGAGNLSATSVATKKTTKKKVIKCADGKKLVHGKCVKRKKVKGSAKKSTNGKGTK